jgi:hypothetical protein
MYSACNLHDIKNQEASVGMNGRRITRHSCQTHEETTSHCFVDSILTLTLYLYPYGFYECSQLSVYIHRLTAEILQGTVHPGEWTSLKS